MKGWIEVHWLRGNDPLDIQCAHIVSVSQDGDGRAHISTREGSYDVVESRAEVMRRIEEASK